MSEPPSGEERGATQEAEAAVAAEQLDRRRAALAEREHELAERIREFEELERRRAEVAQKIARDTAAVAERRRALDREEERARERLEAAARRLRETEERLWALEGRAEVAERRRETVPSTASVSEAVSAPATRGPTQWNLDLLEHLAAKHGSRFPETAEEWSLYLVYLRDFAGLDRMLPESFDGLVLEVFGDLIELERR